MATFLDAAVFSPTAPLYQQLYEHLRGVILAGQLKQGTKLPSTRALADELGISRNTVLNAYNQLLAEGYLEGVSGSGTFVACVLPEMLLTSPQVPAPQPKADAPPRLSQSSQRMLAAPTMPSPVIQTGKATRAFRSSVPALDAFPYAVWSKLVAKQTRYLSGKMLVYQDRRGYAPLREAIADYVTVARRVRCTADQIIMVSGSQGALDLAARVLLDPGDAAWIEDPGYLGARGALLSVGAEIIPVPVDHEGLIVEAGIHRAPNARVVYLTPSHQFPLGVTMSLSRRLAILEWARQAGAYLLEDDYDGEYRYAGHPLASLQGLDDSDRVLYIGTFSKVLFPSLRLGYLIVPPALVAPFVAMRGFMDTHVSILEQMVLTEFITAGHFTRHIRRMRTLYAERRTMLINLLQALPLEVYAPDTGMHLVGWLPDGVSDQMVRQHTLAQGIDTMTVSHFCLEPIQRQGLLLGYTGINEHEMKEGVRRLAIALNEAGVS